MLKPVTVGILQEPQIAPLKMVSDVLQPEHRSFSDQVEAEQLDAMIDYVHDLIAEAARQIGIPLSVERYQIHSEVAHTTVMGKNRARAVTGNDILLTIDPSVNTYAFATKPRRQHPLQRGVAGFTDREQWSVMRPLVSASRVPLAQQIEEGERQLIARVFSLHLPTNEDDRKKVEPVSLATLRNALSYPAIEPIKMKASDAIGIIDGDHPLAKPQNRHLLSTPDDVEPEGETV